MGGTRIFFITNITPKASIQKLELREFVKVSYSLPSHVGKLKKPVLHTSHLSLMIFVLQLHTPLSSHASPFDPSALQLQTEK